MARTAIAALLLVSVNSSAQDTPGPTCDPNLQPFQETEDQRTIRQTCETHVGCRMFFAYVRTTCNAANFLRKLKDKITPAKPIDNDAVAEAALDDFPRSTAGDTALSKAREAGRLTANRKTIKDTFKKNDGIEAYREVQNNDTINSKGEAVMYSTSKGAIIYSDGAIFRGSLKNNYSVNDMVSNEPMGTGQVIWPQGNTKAGYIDPNFKLSGPSAWTGTDANGLKSMLEGTFLKDLPDGEMVRRYSDGRARRERWSRGQLLKVGEMSGPDGIPPPLGDVQIPLPPGPYWEGVNDQKDADRWRKFLSCNGKVVAIGPFYPEWPAKPVDPDPALCPNPETYRNGFIRVFGANGAKRDEFWCAGRMIASTAWKAIGPYPSLPQNLRCDDPIQVVKKVVKEGPGAGAQQNTIAQGRVSLPRGTFPCPLSGNDLWDRLKPCMDVRRFGFFDEDRAAIFNQCRPQLTRLWNTEMMAHSNLGAHERSFLGGNAELGSAPGWGTLVVDYPWGAMRPELLTAMTSGEVSLLNAGWIGYVRIKSPSMSPQKLQAYAPVYTCISRYALCKAGNRQFCA